MDSNSFGRISCGAWPERFASSTPERCIRSSSVTIGKRRREENLISFYERHGSKFTVQIRSDANNTTLAAAGLGELDP